MIYLASNSPRRKRLLKDAGIACRVVRSDYIESSRNASANPVEFVKQQAAGKAEGAVARVREGVILAADTVISLRGKVIGKPQSKKDARRMLSLLQGRWHVVYTGVAVLWISASRIKRRKVFTVRTHVLMKPMTLAHIDRYIRKVHTLDKAGAYAIQSRVLSIVEKVKGSFGNVIGLPVERLDFLKKIV